MKKLYLQAKNHMDPSWRRCFVDHFREPATGYVVRPYSELEEMQILEYMDFAEHYGVKYQIEQTLVVKKFLERNPEQKKRFAELVKRGFFELAGGGETVIDYNMTQGESWVRDHLYSVRYLQKEFGVKPRYAITPDLFGLPCQLPQFFRSVGYDADILFDRVLLDNKPFWRGLDGTDIVLDNRWLNRPEPVLRTADTVQMRPCPVCKGEGCRSCLGTGFDISYNMTRPDKELRQGSYYGNMSADELIDKLLETEVPEYYVHITTEEPLIGDNLFKDLKQAGIKRGVEVYYVTCEDNHDLWCSGQVERLRTGCYNEDEVDFRKEGNPIFTGVSSSRIEIKQRNRELEQLLYECENLAVIARLHGGYDGDPLHIEYPSDKIEYLWNKMSFIQFHDCLPGTVCDAAALELERCIREVRRGAMRLYCDAADEIIRNLKLKIPAGFKAAVFFNPTALPLEFPEIDLTCTKGSESISVYRSDGSRVRILSQNTTEGMADTYISAVISDYVPAFSCAVYFYEPSAHYVIPDICLTQNSAHIENEYYRVEVSRGRISSVYDKTLGRFIINDGGLVLSQDDGNPWERLTPDGDNIPVYANNVSISKNDVLSEMILTGSYSDSSHRIYKLDYSVKLSLRSGEKLLRINTDINWHGEQTRVYFSFEPSFEHDGNLYCEVPFGMLARDYYDLNEDGVCDDIPSVGYAGVSDGNISISFIKGGLPGCSVKNKKNVRLALLRSVANCDADDPNSFYKTSNAYGKHYASFAIASARGCFSESGFWNVSARFNAVGFTRCLSESIDGVYDAGRILTGFTFPANIRLSSLKWSEDGWNPVIRVWECAGKQAFLKAPEGYSLLRCNSLEETLKHEPAFDYALRPFEIASFRLIKQN